MELSPKERSLLLDVLNNSLEDMRDTRTAMIEDRATLKTFEDFDSVLQDHAVLTETVESIRTKLIEEMTL